MAASKSPRGTDSEVEGRSRSGVEILAVPCLRDNYAYLLVGQSGRAVVVDPSEAAPVERALAERGLRLAEIWNTHHHKDHTGGNEELARRWGAPVSAHASDRGRIPGQTRALEDGEVVEFEGEVFRILHVPGHTQGAIVYLGREACFTGDTLFCAGAGRLLEGTAEQLFRSFGRLRGELRPDVRVFVGHEYTENNLRFAVQAEPDAPEIARRLSAVRGLRARGEFCGSAPWSEELATNLFLRAPSLERFTELRRAKDEF